MNFGVGTVSGKAANQMDWGVNNAFKTFKDMEPKSVMDMAVIPMDPVDIGLGSSEKGNAISTVKPRKKTMTSVYLKFFETAADGKSRRCKFCGQSYSIATATGNFLALTAILLGAAASSCIHFCYPIEQSCEV